MGSVDARALRLFDRYADMPAAQRAAGLGALAREDPELHAALVALLDADASPHLQDRAPVAAVAARMQAAAAPQPDGRIGTQVGPWRIVDTLGQGGMGTVYRVERSDDQYQQTAALKYVRADVSSPALIKAFMDERNVLASLNHPNVVPLLDGGVDESGQPWFVMQQVDGEPIDQWCDRRSLSVGRRVELFMQACDAVAYAHGRGILHQDIKPSNLLVAADGHVRLLDFGLSIPVAGGNAGARLAVTSGYTAPEVLRGEPPGFGVDVYSLGVVLYQLLCGQYPGASDPATRKARQPSALVEKMAPAMLAERGAANAGALRRRLAGELDSIAVRATADEVADRYPAVDPLQADLRAWMAGRPVAAHGSGVAYRLGCFVRRHAYLTATGVVAVFALGAIGGLWAWQQAQAERERVSASQLDRLLESTMGMATLSGLGDMPLTPAELLRRNERYLRDRALDGQADVRSRGLSVLARSWAALGDYGKAEALAEEASREGAGDALLDAFNAATLAQIRNQRASYADAEATARKGLSLLPVRWSDQYRLARVRLMAQLASAQTGQGDSRAAFETLSAAIEGAAALPPAIGDPVVAQLLVQRGTWHRWRFRMAESETDLRRAIELAEGVEPVIADDARESLVRTVRAARKPGREKRALDLSTALLQSRQRTLGERHPQTGTAWAELALIRLQNADNAGAQDAVREARGILEASVGQAHPAYARTHIGQAFIDAASGRIDQASEQTELGLAGYRKSLGDVHEFTLESRFLLGAMHWSRFSLTNDERHRDKAIEIIRSGIDDSVRVHGDVAATHRMALANLLANSGDRDGAKKELARAHADAIRQYGAGSQESLHIRFTELAAEIDGDGDPEWIERTFQELRSDLDEVDTVYARAIAHSVWVAYAQFHWKHERFDAARAALLEARREGEKAGQSGWAQGVDVRLKELEADAARARD